MTKQNRAVTAHGEVEYETVECDSCESEVMKSEAKRIVVGDLKDTVHWSHKSTKEFHFDNSTYATGWVCQYCSDGPLVGVPSVSSARKWLRRIPEPAQFILVMVALCLGTLCAISLITALV